MDTYTVHILYNQDGKALDMQYVPEGCSFWGVIFGPLWLMYNGLVRAMVLYGALVILIIQFDEAEITDPGISLLLLLILSICIGFFGRDSIRAKLTRSGYKFDDVVLASSEAEAQLKYVTKYLNAGNG